ncbi:hypothetical protein LUZ60_007977 [Juncus effusus]|nr:hypothetical protein LUZ60_007977 [Juncus effusus]
MDEYSNTEPAFSKDSVYESGSDMDESSDSGLEIYPTSYSTDSSPHEEILNRWAPHAGSNRKFSKARVPTYHARLKHILIQPEEELMDRHPSEFVTEALHAPTPELKKTIGSMKMKVQETYSCRLKLRSSQEDGWIPIDPGSDESRFFFPNSLGDDLMIDVYDSKATLCGRVTAQVAIIAEESTDKLKWWPLFREPEHELVGRVQLCINYTTAQDENNSLTFGYVAESVAYDIALEVAMKSQQFQERNLSLHNYWKWLLMEFSSYYGISDEYARLRYVSYVMDVATPTSDCLTLLHDLLEPVVMKSRIVNTLSLQEKRILRETGTQIEQILAMVFEKYKSLDESILSGMEEVYMPPSRVPAPALVPAVELYILLHGLSPEAELKLSDYFQTAARKRMRHHLSETDEYISGNANVRLTDHAAFTTMYNKMISLCRSTRDEIFTDIHIQHVLPSFMDLPNLVADIYCGELIKRLSVFLAAYPPTDPSPPVTDLVIAVADFENDLASWNICPHERVDATMLFHPYFVMWIEDKRRALLESCKLDTVKWSVRTKHMTTPFAFADDMCKKLNDMPMEYEFIICRWPEYTILLENVMADVEKAVMDALEVQYANELAPLKDCISPKKFGLKYVQKLTKRKPALPYVVTDETKMHNATKLQRIMRRNIKKFEESKEVVVMESDIKAQIQPLSQQIMEMLKGIHRVFDVQQFVDVSRGLWERMGQVFNKKSN